jgi:hypothetical protein
VQIAQCDVTKSPGLSGRFLVTALPTIYHVKDGVFRQYQGSRDKDSFISFVEDKKWAKVEPVPFWQSPGSFHMTIVSEFFRYGNRRSKNAQHFFSQPWTMDMKMIDSLCRLIL